MNHALFGDDDKTERYVDLAQPKGFLLVDDGAIADVFAERFKATVLDFSAEELPQFNILKAAKQHHKFTRDFIQLLDTIYPEGASTLTKRTTNRLLRNALRLLLLSHNATLLDINRVFTDEGFRETLLERCSDKVVRDAWERIPRRKDLDKELDAIDDRTEDLLSSPAVRALCAPKSTFKLPARCIVRVDRAQLGEFDAFVVATFFIGQAQGQIIVPDFGAFGRDFHVSLLRQDRLVVGVHYLAELGRPEDKLFQAVLSIKDKTIYRTSREDAERLISYVNPTGNPSVLVELSDGEYRTT